MIKSDKQYFKENEQEPIREVDKYAEVNTNINAYYFYANNYDLDFNTKSKHLIKHIQIDMTSRKKDLLKCFASKIDKWSKQYLKEGRDRQEKKTEYDPWEVYDLYLECGNYSEVARRMSGLSGNITDNYKLKKSRIKVKNAYEFAQQMIEAVKPSPSRKPLFRK